MMSSSNSVDESDAGNGSEGEGAFPASYQPPLAGLMSKGKLSCVGPLHSVQCVPVAIYLNVHRKQQVYQVSFRVYMAGLMSRA